MIRSGPTSTWLNIDNTTKSSNAYHSNNNDRDLKGNSHALDTHSRVATRATAQQSNNITRVNYN